MNNRFRLYIEKLKLSFEKETLTDVERKELWNRIQQANETYKRRVKLRVWVLSAGVAASVLLGVWLWNRVEALPPSAEIDYTSILSTIMSGEFSSTDVQLLLSDDQKLSITDNESEIIYQEEGGVKINEEPLEMDERLQGLNRLIVPIGKRASLILSDGSKVWVNSGTLVVYPVEFAEGRREIYVEGEAFLDVAHKDGIPFIVKTKDVEVTVLGTQFNVSTSEKKGISEVVLVSGKVEIATKEQAKKILAPNDLFTYHQQTSTSSVRRVDTSDYVAWKDGYYQFNQRQMDKVLSKIARYYGIEVDWEAKVVYLTCSGKLDLKENPEEVFRLLQQAAPIEVERVNEKYYVKIKN